MSVATVAGHVLIPHRPDWRQRVEWGRTWQTVIRDSVTGAEQRVATRPRPRRSLKFRVVPFDDIERHTFEDRLRAAAKAGKAAVPYWGQGVQSAGALAASDVTAPLTASPLFEWDNDDWLLIGRERTREWNTWEVVQVDFFDTVPSVHLKTGLANSYPAGSRFYGLLFGRITFSDADLLDNWRHGVSVTVEETAVRPVPEPSTS